MKIKISCDSTCDLTNELYCENNVGVIPLHVIKDGISYSDGIDITSADILSYMVSGSGLCSTAAISVGEYTDCFSSWLKEYDAVIHINISSKFSSCYQNAVIAAADFDNVYPIDSYNLSTGSGHLVLDAVRLASLGIDAEVIADTLKEKAQRLDVSFVLDTLTYLHKGGRCSAVAAMGANVLKLKPCIEVHDGAMSVGKKYRGNLDRVLLQYVEDKLKGRNDLDLSRIFVTATADMPQEIIDSVKDKVISLQPFEDVITTTAGCTITSHCGTRCLGILFYTR